MKNNNFYTIPKKYKKAEIKMLQKDRNEIYNEMNNSIDKIIGETLQSLYDYKNDEYLIGIHRTNSNMNDFFSKGIVVRSPEFDSHVQVFKNFPFFLREIKYCESYKMSTGCFIVKVLKRDVRNECKNKETKPIYYIDGDGLIRLRPEFIVAYVPVENRKLKEIILNNQNHNIYNENTKFIYDDNVRDEDKKML